MGPPATSKEYEQRPAVRVGVPERADERDEPVVPTPQIDRLGGEHDLHARSEAQHDRAAVTMAAMCSGLTPPRKVIRVAPISTRTSIDSAPSTGTHEGAPAGAAFTTTGSRRGLATLRARLRSSVRHHLSVDVFTPCRRATASASPCVPTSATRSSYHFAGCLIPH